jgi:hypothetical protein
MLVVYHHQDATVKYDTTQSDLPRLQKLAVDVAKLLLSNDDQVSISSPMKAPIHYALHSGEATLGEVKQAGVVNVFSSEEIEGPIINPVKDAIRLIAQFELLRRIVEQGDNSQITGIIRKNHPNLNDPESSIANITATIIEIKAAQQRPMIASLSFFKPAGDSNIKPSTVKAIEALKSNKVHNLSDVEKILPESKPDLSRRLSGA